MRVDELAIMESENTRLIAVSGKTIDTAFKELFLNQFDEESDKWKPELGDRDKFLTNFMGTYTKEIKQIVNADLALQLIDETKREKHKKTIKILTIYVIAMLKLDILSLQRQKLVLKRQQAIDNYISELVRKKIQNTNCICFRIGANGNIEVFFRFNKSEYAVLDGKEILPCSYHMLANSKWDTALKELELLINSPQTKEHDLQKYFEVYPELLFDKEFDTVIPQAVISPDMTTYNWKADFVLSPFNQFEFAKIIELKLPSIKTTKIKKPEHISFTSQIWHSIQQVKDYASAFEKTDVRNKFKERYKVDIFKPDMHLIIGRSWDIAEIDTIKKMKKDSQVKIETWDEVLTRLKRQYS